MLKTKTNWEDVIEILGILAVVASLIALVIELRQTHPGCHRSRRGARINCHASGRIPEIRCNRLRTWGI